MVLYLLASVSFAVFAWAGGFDTCVPGAAITQSRITATEAPNDGAEPPNNGAEAPCSDQQVLCVLASILFAVYV